MPSTTREYFQSFGAGHLPGHLCVEIVTASAELVQSRLAVRREVMAPNGFLHAASVVALADTSCGYGCVAALPKGASGFTTIELKANFIGTAREGTEWGGRPLEQVLANLSSLPEDKQAAVRNNGGGHANHTLFWQIMKPGGGGDPTGALAQAIGDTFGDADQLKAAINDGGVKRFGSGWTWLVWDGTGLAVYSTANQDSPLLQSDVPLLGIDVWEHAYYLKYQNRRPDYLEAWWNVVNWDAVQQRFESAR